MNKAKQPYRATSPLDVLSGEGPYKLDAPPEHVLGEKVRLNPRGYETLKSIYKYQTVESRKRWQHQCIADLARKGEPLRPDMMKDPEYSPNPENTLRQMLAGVAATEGVGEVVGVLLKYGQVIGEVANACYLGTIEGAAGGPQYCYQVLFRWPSPGRGELCFIFEFQQFDLEKVE